MYLFFVEKTLQQDMLDFFQGARGQDFHDITLIVDGEPVGAHKVRVIALVTIIFSPDFCLWKLI